MSEDARTTEEQAEASVSVDTKHEAHPHARPRVLWGVAAVALVVVGVVVWSRWGDAIKEACLGEDGACPVELEEVPEGGVQFETPEGY